MTPIENIMRAARFEPVEHVPVAGAITDFYLAALTPGLDSAPESLRQVRMAERAEELFPEIPVVFMLNPTPDIYPELFRRLRAAADGGPVRLEHIREVSVPDPAGAPENIRRFDEIQTWLDTAPPRLKEKFGYCDGVLRFENPFDQLTAFIGSSEWFLKIRTEPKFVEAAMELFTEASLEGARALAQKTGSPKLVILAEDFPGYINRASFERFALPYHRRLMAEFPNAVRLLHNDSNTSHLLDLMPHCGMDIFHFGYEVDVKAAKEAFGGKAALMGNLAPMTVLATGPEPVVRAECERIIRAGAPGGGFIFATGGEVNPGTDPARVNLMLDCAREFGGY